MFWLNLGSALLHTASDNQPVEKWIDFVEIKFHSNEIILNDIVCNFKSIPILNFNSNTKYWIAFLIGKLIKLQNWFWKKRVVE
jgi:predicted methyltransferase